MGFWLVGLKAIRYTNRWTLGGNPSSDTPSKHSPFLAQKKAPYLEKNRAPNGTKHHDLNKQPILLKR